MRETVPLAAGSLRTAASSWMASRSRESALMEGKRALNGSDWKSSLPVVYLLQSRLSRACLEGCDADPSGSQASEQVGKDQSALDEELIAL